MSSRRLLGGIIIGLVVAACSSSGSSTTLSGVDVTTITVDSTVTTEDSTTTTGLEPGDTIPREDVPLLALYLAAIDRGLMGTEYEGDVYLDPDGYVNVGRLFCELLDAGLEPTAVLESYVAALEEESDQLSDDDLVLGGVILGATVQLICPEYLDDLKAVSGG